MAETKKNLKIEKRGLYSTIEFLRSHHNSIEKQRSEFVSSQVQTSVVELENLKNKLVERKQALRILNKLADLTHQKEEYNTEINPLGDDYVFDGLTSKVTREFCDVVEGLLIDWGYGEEISVSFNENKSDVVINGADRNLAGKGYRALSYSAFCIGLMHTCIKLNLPHSGFVVLDSPLCTLRSKHVENSSNVESQDVISDDTKEAFYSSIAKYEGLGQIIVFDNDGPANPGALNIGYTKFTKDKHKGRYGFFKI